MFQIPHNHRYINISFSRRDYGLCLESSDGGGLTEDVKYYGINTVCVVLSLSKLSVLSLEVNKTEKKSQLVTSCCHRNHKEV